MKTNYFSDKLEANNEANQNNLKVPKELDEYEKSENGLPIVFLGFLNLHYSVDKLF